MDGLLSLNPHMLTIIRFNKWVTKESLSGLSGQPAPSAMGCRMKKLGTRGLPDRVAKEERKLERSPGMSFSLATKLLLALG